VYEVHHAQFVFEMTMLKRGRLFDHLKKKVFTRLRRGMMITPVGSVSLIVEFRFGKNTGSRSMQQRSEVVFFMKGVNNILGIIDGHPGVSCEGHSNISIRGRAGASLLANNCHDLRTCRRPVATTEQALELGSPSNLVIRLL
jgi:hypothetical protein